MHKIILNLLYLAPIIIFANETQFEGIVQQKNDYSCGTATIATLIQGLYGRDIKEQEIVDTILKGKDETTISEIKEKGYSLLNLQNGSTKLGYKAMWKKIKPQYLPMIKQPIVLLIGLKSEFPHFVVLKGIRDGEAYLADPIQGNVRMSYQKLIEESLSSQYPSWYVMATQTPSKNWRKNSILSLSNNKKERTNNHITATQANIRNIVSLSKKGQLSFSVDYDKDFSKIDYQDLELEKVRDSYEFGVTYGLSDNSELKTSFYTSESTIKSNVLKKDSSLKGYSLGLVYKDKFDNSNSLGVIYGVNANYLEEYKLTNTAISAIFYNNINGASIVGGGSLTKGFSRNSNIDESLPDYGVGLHLGWIKPFATKYSASVMGSYQFEEGGEEIYRVKSSLSWIYNKKIQIQPNMGLSFKSNLSKPDYSVGLGVVYLGGW